MHPFLNYCSLVILALEQQLQKRSKEDNDHYQRNRRKHHIVFRLYTLTDDCETSCSAWISDSMLQDKQQLISAYCRRYCIGWVLITIVFVASSLNDFVCSFSVRQCLLLGNENPLTTVQLISCHPAQTFCAKQVLRCHNHLSDIHQSISRESKRYQPRIDRRRHPIPLLRKTSISTV